jgi:hypothetical protein
MARRDLVNREITVSSWMRKSLHGNSENARRPIKLAFAPRGGKHRRRAII